MKRLFIFSGLFVLGLFVVVALTIFFGGLHQKQKRSAFCKEQLSPRITFVENFKSKNGRLPTIQEFSSFDAERKTLNPAIYQNMKESPDFIKKLGGGRTDDYSIQVWYGERFEFYYSWTGQFSP